MSLLEFNDDEIKQTINLFHKYVHERINSFELNFLRIIGLLSAIRPFYTNHLGDTTAPWWLDSPKHTTHIAKLRKFIKTLEDAYTHTNLKHFSQRIYDTDTKDIEEFLGNLPKIVTRYRTGTTLPIEKLQDIARTCIKAEFGTDRLQYLGIGEEGVVYSDGKMVYKYFHYWNARNRNTQVTFLQSLIEKISEYTSLPAIKEVRQNDNYVIVVYPYESGKKYRGGNLNGILTLLRECRSVGIACRNIHPDNLLDTPNGLKIIDYGSDIVPIDDTEFENMCRRAFLTYRFYFRSDLKLLLNRSLTDSSLPELAGFERFKNAVTHRDIDTLFYGPITNLIVDEKPASVLDYGCGDGKISESLARHKIKVTGYDPDLSAIRKCQKYNSFVTYGGPELLTNLLGNSVRFDVVVCSRVLCIIAGKPELDAILKDLRRMVTDSGTVFVTVCNPFYLSADSTELAKKHLPDDFHHDSFFQYTKTLTVNGNTRLEVHHGYSAYRHMFVKAGLYPVRVQELDGTDIISLLPASDHLVFSLSPLQDTGPKVSLLIKTRMAEWRTIERQVRHQVEQLETPTKFAEKVVVVDTSDVKFSRQYDQSDITAHQTAMDRLLADGVVDRIVYAPQDTDVIRETYQRWFGIESAKTHSAKGQQLFATLFGFDSCMGDYVLQIDSDLLICRTDKNHNYLSEMTDVFCRDSEALFVPMSICGTEHIPYSTKGPNGDWRVEVRGCLFDRKRLESVLPIHNKVTDGRFAYSWHRAFDHFIVYSRYNSYRGGNSKTAFIHVPNYYKTDIEKWMNIMDSVERGHVPAVQSGCVNLVGTISDWLGPKRTESFVFVICGRNVKPGKFKQCFESIVCQRCNDWGAVVIDDASDNEFGEYAEMLTGNYADKITLIKNETRHGALYNTWNAVTRVCVDSNSVIITLDADDALIGDGALDRIRHEYENGADMTVGSMLRLDKDVTYTPNFEKPRRWDSNVWQHIRTFRKYLFDEIDINDLKIDGEWIDSSTDWAFMVPIVEMAHNPRHIPDKLYLYEPSTIQDDDKKKKQDRIIEYILSKPKYRKFKSRV